MHRGCILDSFLVYTATRTFTACGYYAPPPLHLYHTTAPCRFYPRTTRLPHTTPHHAAHTPHLFAHFPRVHATAYRLHHCARFTRHCLPCTRATGLRTPHLPLPRLRSYTPHTPAPHAHTTVAVTHARLHRAHTPPRTYCILRYRRAYRPLPATRSSDAFYTCRTRLPATTAFCAPTTRFTLRSFFILVAPHRTGSFVYVRWFAFLPRLPLIRFCLITDSFTFLRRFAVVTVTHTLFDCAVLHSFTVSGYVTFISYIAIPGYVYVPVYVPVTLELFRSTVTTGLHLRLRFSIFYYVLIPLPFITIFFLHSIWAVESPRFARWISTPALPRSPHLRSRLPVYRLISARSTVPYVSAWNVTVYHSLPFHTRRSGHYHTHHATRSRSTRSPHTRSYVFVCYAIADFTSRSRRCLFFVHVTLLR